MDAGAVKQPIQAHWHYLSAEDCLQQLNLIFGRTRADKALAQHGLNTDRRGQDWIPAASSRGGVERHSRDGVDHEIARREWRDRC